MSGDLTFSQRHFLTGFCGSSVGLLKPGFCLHSKDSSQPRNVFLGAASVTIHELSLREPSAA